VLHIKRRTAQGTFLSLDFHLVRAVVDQHTVFSRDTNGIRHITIHNFENDYVVDDFYQAVSEAKEKGMKGVVVNLRGNPGGRLDYTLAMLEMVVPRGLILTTHFRDQGSVSSTQTDYVVEDGYVTTAEKVVGAPDSSKKLDAQPRVAYTPTYAAMMHRNPHFVMEHPLLPIIGEDMPFVVEVNVESYSASEVFSGAIQATHRGTIVGEPSAGKGAIMTEVHLPEGGSVMITSGQFYPGGEDTKLKGILPDRLVKASEDFGKTDPVDDAANAVIEEEYARLQARKTLTVERMKVNGERFESEMKERDDNDLKPPAVAGKTEDK
jgi:carboxyl-terminal processing protease